ncbi:hypothetical protein [Bacillus phage CP-51]|uniref:Uncharacterized protein n=1 Tax=Bacillus phage CP-51 TaxID=1391188 RepID=A0A068EMH8_9CAUD|nr:hypothetical protein OZ73_gp158 [Bacillus phage CP-51]AID50593.1 hypothetical protein [Bacillus phage CP-51]
MPLNIEYSQDGLKGHKTYESMSAMRRFMRRMALTDYALARYTGDNPYDKSAYTVLQRGNGYKHSSEY